MKACLAAFSLLAIGTPILAHDFWIQPNRFSAAPGAALPATFQIGHAALRERWGVGADRVLLLRAVSASGMRDIRRDLTMGGQVADLVTRLDSPGIHVLAMQSTYAVSELPAVRFNDYAKEEGLALIVAHRARTGKVNAAGRERYSRRAKALVRVGNPTAANQAVATRAVGLKLEIVPERNPYALGASRMLPVRVLYNGKRLPGATVKLTDLARDAKPVAIGVTDRDGRVAFRIPPRSDWLLNVVWGEPVLGDARVDYDTTFSSLTFGYGQAPTR